MNKVMQEAYLVRDFHQEIGESIAKMIRGKIIVESWKLKEDIQKLLHSSTQHMHFHFYKFTSHIFVNENVKNIWPSSLFLGRKSIIKEN